MRSVSVRELKAALDAGAVTVIDVRAPHEYAEGHVPGADLIPLMTVPARMAELPTEGPIYLVCAVGARSAQAAQFLAGQGLDAVNVDGGTVEWAAAGFPVER